MARHERKSFDLTDAEQRDLAMLIQQGKPLPEKYRFILLEHKSEVELVWSGNKLILSSLKAGALRRQIEDAGGLKLIYIDPPFDVGADFSMDIEVGGETFHKEANLLEQIAYRDTWGRGADSFISMLYERLILMRDLLTHDGSIYVHMGPAKSHLVRAVLDEVFGRDRCLREVIWKRVSSRSHGSYYPATHGSILFYAKTERVIWNQLYEPLDGEYVQS